MKLRAAKTPFMLPAHLFDQPGKKVEDYDISWVLDHARLLGHKEISLPPIDFSSTVFNFVNEQILAKNLVPLHHISAQEFSLEGKVKTWLSQGIHFALMIYEPLSPCFLNHIEELLDYKSQIRCVLIVRKDWNFFNTFKSLPYFMRENLFIDFPTHLKEGDPFFHPAEVSSVLKKLAKNFTHFQFRSYSPHFQLYNQFLSTQIHKYSRPQVKKNEEVQISMITSSAKLVAQLEEINSLQAYSDKIEILLTRWAHRKTSAVLTAEKLNVTKLWVHGSEKTSSEEEDLVHLRNYGATFAQGKILTFLENEDLGDIEMLLKKLLNSIDNEAQDLKEKPASSFFKDQFLKCGGFDSLYAFFGLELLELNYRYSKSSQDKAICSISPPHYLKEDLGEFKKNVGARLFYSQYFDLDIYKKLTPNTSEALIQLKEEKSPWISPQLKYRLIRVKDAYLSLYKATPKVAIEGHFKFLWSFLFPYLLKTYFILHRFYFDYVFRALFPVRKIYYMFEYQYEKRVLGLHGRTEQLKRVKS